MAFLWYLHLAPDMLRKLRILWHYCYTLSVYHTKIGIFKQACYVRFCGFMDHQHGHGLNPYITLLLLVFCRKDLCEVRVNFKVSLYLADGPPLIEPRAGEAIYTKEAPQLIEHKSTEAYYTCTV